MFRQILHFAETAKRVHCVTPGDVLEIGSLNVNGSIRSVYESDSKSYIGVDMQAGPGVDVVCNAHRLVDYFHHDSFPRFKDGFAYRDQGRDLSHLAKFDTILCCEMLEHDPTPWVTLMQIHTLLKKGGHLFISTPTYGFPYHGYPKDYYRYTEDTYKEVFFDGMEILDINRVIDDMGWPAICCLGRKL